jgi:hypothetical protein
MYIEDVMELTEKYGWDAEIIAWCALIKDIYGNLTPMLLTNMVALER